jgi:hypothetical protein
MSLDVFLLNSVLLIIAAMMISCLLLSSWKFPEIACFFSQIMIMPVKFCALSRQYSSGHERRISLSSKVAQVLLFIVLR